MNDVTEETVPFKVIKTSRIKDQNGKYVREGETAYLNEELAERYLALGYIKPAVGDLFDAQRLNTLAAQALDDSGAASGNGDENAGSEDGSSDSGTDSSETGTRSGTKRTRK